MGGLCCCFWCADCVFGRKVFFFKQKTAYEIVDCDWSSDVCSSDLVVVSLWQVPDQQTADLMIDFHTERLKQGNTPQADRKSVV